MRFNCFYFQPVPQPSTPLLCALYFTSLRRCTFQAGGGEILRFCRRSAERLQGSILLCLRTTTAAFQTGSESAIYRHKSFL
ncbi:hypothetical protein U0070_019119 [Myodes glareolus]|uniref:Secreted protein n=1 Tax=Myodes glareolus TaxID=447135 RepID=A0AAW0H8Z8_MYOGA